MAIQLAFYTTDEAGDPITTDISIAHAPRTTNYTLGNNNLSGGAETITLGTGNFTLSVAGTAAVTVAAGTAVGTGFAQATEGSPVTFNISTGGTITLTLDSGTLDVVDGKAVKQVEAGTVATDWVLTAAASATRDISQIRASGAMKQTEGTYYMLWEPAVTAAGDQALIAVTTAAGLLTATATGLESTDGTNTATVTDTFSGGTKYHLAVRYGSATLQIGYRAFGGASWTFGTAADYDGEFTADDLFTYLFYGNTIQNDLYTLEVLNKDIGTAGIEERYSLAEVG